MDAEKNEKRYKNEGVDPYDPADRLTHFWA